MHKNVKTTLAVAALAGGLLASSALYAHDSGSSRGSMMGPGMMGQGGMMGMMNMMGQMNQMMETCNRMMQGMMQHREGEPQKPGQTPQEKDKG